MYEFIDLIFEGGTRKSNLTNIIIGKLEAMNRPDLVIKLGSWYRARLHDDRIDDTYSKTILISLSHALFLKGEFERRKEIDLEVHCAKPNKFHGLTQLMIDQSIVHTDFCLGDWEKANVKLKKIYGKLECIYRDPAKLQVEFEHESSKEFEKSVKKLASLGMQETLQSAAFIYDVLGRVDKAIDCLQKAIKLSEEIYGKRHISSTSLNQDIAELYLKKGEVEKARKLISNILAIRKKFLPSYSLSIANSYMFMGKVYTELKEFDSAKLCFDRAMKVYNRIEKRGGLINMPLLTESIAKLAYAKGEYLECEKVVSKAILLYGQYYNVGHPVVVEALELKISCLKAQNKLDESKRVLFTLTNIFRRYKMDTNRINFEPPKAA